MNETVDAEEERVLHATAALRTLVCLGVARHVQHQFLLAAETTLTHRALELIAGQLQQRVVGGGGLPDPGGPRCLGLEVTHVVDAYVPAELLDGSTDLQTTTATAIIQVNLR